MTNARAARKRSQETQEVEKALVAFVLYDNPSAHMFKDAEQITMRFPTQTGALKATLSNRDYNILLNDTAGKALYGDYVSQLAQRWARTNQPNEPALLCTFEVAGSASAGK